MTYGHLAQNWLVSHRNNLKIIDFVEDHLELRSGDRGRTIEGILKHLIKNKFDWLKNLSPKLDFEIPDTNEGDLETMEKLSNDWIMKLVETEANGTMIRGYKSDLFGFVIYLIAHDAHHRGQVMQILADNKVPMDNKLKYGIWDWKY